MFSSFGRKGGKPFPGKPPLVEWPEFCKSKLSNDAKLILLFNRYSRKFLKIICKVFADEVTHVLESQPE
jgi:hypothetical protein